jgi:predicted component of type VI protein secretion system
VQLYNQDEPSSVSSLHCTIFYEQNKFYLTDDNSTNGTFVNGQRLAPNEPFELQSGAEIVLGDLYRQGAKLRFEIAGMGESTGAFPEMEPDFHVDIPAEGSAYPPPQEEIDDFRKTVPGYRLDDESANKTDVFREPPVASPPSARPAASPPPSPRPVAPPPLSQPRPPSTGPRDKKDWKDDLG